MICCRCKDEFEVGTYGVSLTPFGIVLGQKSGLPMPMSDRFPDGQESKFICLSCLYDSEFYSALGLDQTGHDQPSEEEMPGEDYMQLL